MSFNSFPHCVQWDITTRNLDGEVIHQSRGENLVVNTGRSRVLSMTFVPSASNIGGFYYLGVGASATPATVTDTTLTYEFIGNSFRKTLTNTSGNTPTSADIITQTNVINSYTFYEKIQLQAVYSTSDGNTGIFNEYGIFNTSILPGSPTGTSGVMYDHYIDQTPANKSPSNSVTAVVTVYM